MPTLTVRNLDEDTKALLVALAAKNGRSMEAEARVILAEAVHVLTVAELGGLGTRIHERFADLDWEPLTTRSSEPPRAAPLS